jgi:hypothetical protein
MPKHKAKLIFVIKCDKCQEERDAFFFDEKGGLNTCAFCAGSKKILAAKQRYYDRITELGGRIVGKYVDKFTRIQCRCSEGHKCDPAPSHLRPGSGMCRVCSGVDKETSKRKFYKKIKKFGGKVVGEYINDNTPVNCICAEGHQCSPRPSDIKQPDRVNMCKTCANQDSAASEQKFHDRIKELGGEVLGKYVSIHVKIQCRCPKGHICHPNPTSIRRGCNMCITCMNLDFDAAKQKFCDAIKELGGTVVGEYKGANTPVDCVCGQGHKCSPRPSNVRSGSDMCITCAGFDPRVSEQNFRNRIKELGGQVLGDYVNCNTGIKCVCPQGHISNPSPSYIKQGGGMCSSCGLKSEPLCRSIFEDLLKIELPKIRPKWLPWNGFYLELDGYNEDAKIAFEYQGRQHEEYVPRFHRNGLEDFQAQLDRDNFKAQTCKEKGVSLFIIPSTYTFTRPDEMKQFISTLLTEADIGPSRSL